MDTVSIQNISNSNLNLPNLNFSQTLSRWATARSKNVNDLKSLWEESPSRAEVLKDPKFQEDPLVILKKNMLDEIIVNSKHLEAKVRETEKSLLVIADTIDLLKTIDLDGANDQLRTIVKLLNTVRSNLN